MQQYITMGRCWVIEEKKGWGLGRFDEGQGRGEVRRDSKALSLEN